MLFCVASETASSQQIDSTYERAQNEEINRQLIDYGRVLMRNDTLETRQAWYDAFALDLRAELYRADKWPLNRKKRLQRRIERVLRRIEN